MAGSATEDLLSFADDMLKGMDVDEATRAATLKSLLEPSPEPDRAASSAVGCQALPTTPVQVLPRTPQSPTEPPSPAAEPCGHRPKVSRLKYPRFRHCSTRIRH